MDKITDISKIPTLITPRLTLREINSNDADNIFEYACEPETSKFLLWYPHLSIQDTIDFIAWILVIVGGINWGLVGLLNLNLVALIFGFVPFLARLIFILVGVAAGYLIYRKYKK